eukprot:s50_g81.t1
MFATHMKSWEEKELQNPPEHLAVDEPYQCSEAQPAPAEVKADTVHADVAETEEAADCEQCLPKETQRQEESESRLQMLGLSGSGVL